LIHFEVVKVEDRPRIIGVALVHSQDDVAKPRANPESVESGKDVFGVKPPQAVELFAWWQ
jgi:hypothetical protein